MSDALRLTVSAMRDVCEAQWMLLHAEREGRALSAMERVVVVQGCRNAATHLSRVEGVA